MERYVCIHGHFYQPPRENPWLEAIELQDSAYPYHDWNERITVECYAPNAAARILAGEERIVRILNNYGRISFNFGPTLLAWMEDHAPETHESILEADRRSAERFSGHGSALAQCYNHMIMPLANARDRRTQVIWGVRDFLHRFGREPEGMWLPETAADVASLDDLAEAGMRFTILAPHQAGRVRRIGGHEWHDVSGGRIDPSRAYLQRLPSGREIVIFFYDGPTSRAVAFEDLLRNGERFAGRILSTFNEKRDHPQLAHIATDGETYGHHHRHGEMALAYALEHIQKNGLARITNYGEYLERHPPSHEVEIIDDTSWSCAHGVERWRSDCGCRTGGEPGWNQAWRQPLRNALDWLRGALEPAYEREAAALLRDPWQARDEYIDVILDRSPHNVRDFLGRMSGRELSGEERARALKLLELQRHAMLMYTSCGWFFNELSGIETVQVIQYAGRAVQLAQDLFGNGVEEEFTNRLAEAQSNLPDPADGRAIYDRYVKPAAVDLRKVAAHYAVSSLFEPYDPRSRIYCYAVDLQDHETAEAGAARMGVGRVTIASEITEESGDFSFAAVHFGDHNLSGGVREYQGDEAYGQLMREVTAAFYRADFAEVIRLLDRHFEAATYSLRSLFRDEQRRTLDRILKTTLTEAEAVYTRLYNQYAPLMRFLSDLDIPLPNALDMAAEFVLNTQLARAMGGAELDLERIRDLLGEARQNRIKLDEAGLSYALEGTLDWLAESFQAEPMDPELLAIMVSAAELAHDLPFEVNLWTMQNVAYEILREVYPEQRQAAEAGNADARHWVQLFERLANRLALAVD